MARQKRYNFSFAFFLIKRKSKGELMMQIGGFVLSFMVAVFSLESFAVITSKKDFSILPLEVRKVKAGTDAYQNFCQSYSNLCASNNLTTTISYSESIALLNLVSTAVNNEIQFMNDPEFYDQEELWTVPEQGVGDCEDNAIEKKRRLQALGVPRESLYLATAFHNQKYYAHAVLLVVTDRGVMVLDQDSDKIIRWNQAPYIFEASEGPSQKWTYYVQNW